MELADVLITGDAAKLPSEVVALLDPTVPLPADVRFFETRFDLAHLTIGLLIAAGFALATLVLVPFGVLYFIEGFKDPRGGGSGQLGPLGFGLLCALVTWFCVTSVLTGLKFAARQRRGECTRRGTFLTPDALVQATENDTTILPRPTFRGLAGRDVAYELKAERKTFRLPLSFVNATSADVARAIDAWATT